MIARVTMARNLAPALSIRQYERSRSMRERERDWFMVITKSFHLQHHLISNNIRIHDIAHISDCFPKFILCSA